MKLRCTTTATVAEKHAKTPPGQRGQNNKRCGQESIGRPPPPPSCVPTSSLLSVQSALSFISLQPRVVTFPVSPLPLVVTSSVPLWTLVCRSCLGYCYLSSLLTRLLSLFSPPSHDFSSLLSLLPLLSLFVCPSCLACSSILSPLAPLFLYFVPPGPTSLFCLSCLAFSFPFVPPASPVALFCPFCSRFALDFSFSLHFVSPASRIYISFVPPASPLPLYCPSRVAYSPLFCPSYLAFSCFLSRLLQPFIHSMNIVPSSRPTPEGSPPTSEG